MADFTQQPAYGIPDRPGVDARRLWAAGAATAVVAALAAAVGVLVVRGVLGIPVIAPGNSAGAIDYVGAVWVAGFAALGSLVATGLAHVLLLYAPRPMVFLGWIVALVTAALAVWPFSVAVRTDVQVANAVLYVLIGVAVGTSLTSTASQAGRAR